MALTEIQILSSNRRGYYIKLVYSSGLIQRKIVTEIQLRALLNLATSRVRFYPLINSHNEG